MTPPAADSGASPTPKATVIVIGAGGHAKVVLSSLDRMGVQTLGLVDADPARHGGTVLGRPVLGGDAAVLDHPPAAVRLVNGIGGSGPPRLRAAVQRRFAEQGYRFLTVLDPTAIIGPDVEIGEGAQVLAGAVVQPGCRIGVGVIVNSRAAVDHDCRIGDFAHVAPGATLSGDVRVGPLTLIGVGAAVRQGIEIGAETVVGAGAAVVNDLAAGLVAVGVPARSRARKA